MGNEPGSIESALYLRKMAISRVKVCRQEREGREREEDALG